MLFPAFILLAQDGPLALRRFVHHYPLTCHRYPVAVTQTLFRQEDSISSSSAHARRKWIWSGADSSVASGNIETERAEA